MTDVYEEFLVYDLENSGDKKKLEITQDEIQAYLKPEQVLIIIREDLRRIFIWKGSKSPVRKRFISSRVAQELQKELMADARYHRCKIVSIDQGDELQEFLNAFRLESMEVKERLPDMRYVRNIERERMEEAKRTAALASSGDPNKEYYSPILNDKSDDVIVSSLARDTSVPSHKKPTQMVRPSDVQQAIGLSDEQKNKIKDKILKNKVPPTLERQNLILGHTLFGAVSKVTEVFGKNVVETVWEEVKNVPAGMMELDNNNFRVYFNDKKGIVEAVEVLKKKGKSDDSPKEQHKPTARRELPKIPRNDE